MLTVPLQHPRFRQLETLEKERAMPAGHTVNACCGKSSLLVLAVPLVSSITERLLYRLYGGQLTPAAKAQSNETEVRSCAC